MIATLFLRCSRMALLGAALLAASSSGSSLMAQSVAAMVNGEAVTNFDIDQRMKLVQLTTQKSITRAQALDELINDKVKIKEAKRYGLDLSASDVDAAFGNMASRMRMNSDQLVKTLEAKGIRPETLKLRIRSDMTWNSLVRGRFQSSFLVPEKDLAGIQRNIRRQGRGRKLRISRPPDCADRAARFAGVSHRNAPQGSGTAAQPHSVLR